MLSPKNILYGPDGTGRDSYIYFNSGGVFKEASPKHKIQHESPSRERVAVVPSIHCKRLSYQNNGTGRDSYIYSDSGGMYEVYHAKQFFKSLRNETLNRERHTSVILPKIPIKKQALLTKRLSVPKSTKPKVSFNRTYQTIESFIKRFPNTIRKNNS